MFSSSAFTATRALSTTRMASLNEVVIVGAARTPMGSFRGCLSSMSGPQLGALAIEEALRRAKVPKDKVEGVYLGCALPAGMGQAPDRQAAILAGITS